MSKSTTHNRNTSSSPFRKSMRAFLRHRSGMIGLAIVAGFVILALLSHWVAPVDPYIQDPDKKFLPPGWMEGANPMHWLGTDLLGRDLFSRLINGSRISLVIGIISVTVGAMIGVPLGMVSGFWGGLCDTLIMRLIDVMLAFPSTLLAICIVAILEPSLANAMIAIGLVSVPQYARIVRASVLSEKEKEYVLAEHSLGQRQILILFKAILPNILGPILIMASLGFASAVLEGAALSFIGLGAEPPMPEWGALLFEGKQNYYQAWWLVAFPGVAILFTVMGFNLLGDGLRDSFDPKSQSR